MNPEAAKRLRLLASTLSVLAVVAALAVAWGYWRMRASLAILDGTVGVTDLASAVTVERDALGVPTVKAANRVDAARALGWLHAQDRFLQMDLLRRVAAGEISELFGKRALPRDRSARIHGFRKIAQEVVNRLEPKQRALVEAYAAGVNSGLATLKKLPFEYVVLRTDPAPWKPEDVILVIFAMTIDLQFEDGSYERTLTTLRDEFGRDSLAFFAPVATPADAALDGTVGTAATYPSAKLIDLRARKVSDAGGAGRSPSTPGLSLAWDAPRDRFPFAPRDPEAVMGSSAFALAGSLTATGAGLVANDMHLDHGVPNIWYRASLEYEGRKVTGVTLPGAPAVVAGSNGRVAWGFTNSCIDTGDLVMVMRNSTAHTLYHSPATNSLVPFEKRREVIRVKGEPDVVFEFETCLWGPIVNEEDKPTALAHHMVAHHPEATNLTLVEMEGVTTTAEAVAVAHRAGIPAQNIVIADHTGEIAWTVAGKIPKRIGFDGRLPVSWAYGDRKWDGFLTSAEIPVVYGKDTVHPGRIWSANQRHLGGEAQALLGDGAFRKPPRAVQVRDDLVALNKATPRDLLAIQLDDRALFLTPWHKLMQETLTPEAAAKKSRAALKPLLEKWEGRASTESVSYRLVREFRLAVFARTFRPIFAPCLETYPDFSISDLQLEGALQTLLREKPMHLLSAEYASWNDLLLAAVDDVVAGLEKNGVRPEQATWGSFNTARIRHPFSYAFPSLGRWLNMPPDPLPGGADMPRIQSPSNGASERFAVSPGHEAEGIFHMPCGQSAHPLSPFYRAGHAAWVRGEPTPFLPGKTEHTVTLRP